MRRRVAPLAPLLLLLLVLPSILPVSDANLFKVIWSSSFNQTDWSRDKHLFVGDWLNFVFDKYQYSVLEVNKTNYDNCVETNFLTNITRGGRDVFQLNETRPYYFISGFGKCWGGVKLGVNVENIPPPPPSSKNKNDSPVVKSSGLLMFVAWAVYVVLG